MVEPFLYAYRINLLLNKANPARGGLNWAYYFVNHWQMGYNYLLAIQFVGLIKLPALRLFIATVSVAMHFALPVTGRTTVK